MIETVYSINEAKGVKSALSNYIESVFLSLQEIYSKQTPSNLEKALIKSYTKEKEYLKLT